ncbi:Oidioi.mRNA.OKI2018_I69.PAR.g9964.t1.cds [Oikopleura dioica]|uniref:Oidioi.mRNA.OKI2018_I69.PAR.g9964.t1.cds n=1 Tax=Oikopleura dioica TaxID=34765 RepID=A0ABN7RP55_OIKDI|nr:Oidioi.mRNA.OKI2018_I69.PAR.g9964.t1.cds [Oikopleura dioica]
MKRKIDGILTNPASTQQQNGFKDGNGAPSVLQANPLQDDSLSDSELDEILNQRSPSYNFIQDEIEYEDVDEDFPMACGDQYAQESNQYAQESNQYAQESNQYPQESNQYAQQSNQKPSLVSVVASRKNATHLMINDDRVSEYKISYSTKKKFIFECCKLTSEGKTCPKKYDVTIDPALTSLHTKERKNGRSQTYLVINQNVNKNILFDKSFYKVEATEAQLQLSHTCCDAPDQENMEKEIITKIKTYLYDNFQALKFSSPNSIKRQVLEILSEDYTYDELVMAFPNQQQWEQLYRYYRETNVPVRGALDDIENFQFKPEDFLVNSKTIVHQEGPDLYFYDTDTIKECSDISVIQAAVSTVAVMKKITAEFLAIWLQFIKK